MLICNYNRKVDMIFHNFGDFYVIRCMELLLGVLGKQSTNAHTCTTKPVMLC